MENKLDGNYTRMLQEILNKSWRQHPTKQQLYGHLTTPPRKLSKLTNQTCGSCWRTKDELMMYSCGPLHMNEQRQDDKLEPTHISSVPIWDVALKTCRKQKTIEKGGEKGSVISVLIVRHDIYIYIYIYRKPIDVHTKKNVLIFSKSWNSLAKADFF